METTLRSRPCTAVARPLRVLTWPPRASTSAMAWAMLGFCAPGPQSRGEGEGHQVRLLDQNDSGGPPDAVPRPRRARAACGGGGAGRARRRPVCSPRNPYTAAQATYRGGNQKRDTVGRTCARRTDRVPMLAVVVLVVGAGNTRNVGLVQLVAIVALVLAAFAVFAMVNVPYNACRLRLLTALAIKRFQPQQRLPRLRGCRCGGRGPCVRACHCCGCFCGHLHSICRFGPGQVHVWRPLEHELGASSPAPTAAPAPASPSPPVLAVVVVALATWAVFGIPAFPVLGCSALSRRTGADGGNEFAHAERTRCCCGGNQRCDGG